MREVLPVKNLTFRLNPKKGAYPDQGEGGGKPVYHIEIRLEEGYYSDAGYELLATVQGSTKKDGKDVPPLLEPAKGATILMTGVLVPLEKKQPAGAASALLDLPFTGSMEFVTFPLLLKYVPKDGEPILDAYNVQHTKDGWRLSRDKGGFTRFEAQGSY